MAKMFLEISLYNRSNEALGMYKKVYQDVQSWMASGSDENMRYNLVRIPIDSCDFSLGNYTYVEEGDETLETFDISRDKKSLIPMIKDAMKNNEIIRRKI